MPSFFMLQHVYVCVSGASFMWYSKSFVYCPLNFFEKGLFCIVIGNYLWQ